MTTDQQPKYSRPTCRGSYMLRTACGHCERCAEERARMGVAEASVPVARAFAVRLSELEKLWAWHKDEQFRLADKEEYSEAEDHKERAKEIRAFLDRTPKGGPANG